MEGSGISVFTLFVLGVTVVYAVLAFGVGKLAEKQGRNFVGWFILSLILSPILVALLLLLLGKSTAAAVEELSREQTIKVRCTECGDAVDEAADFCPNCGSELPDVTSDSETAEKHQKTQTSESRNLSSMGILLTVAVTLLFALVGVYAALQTGTVHRGIGLIGGIGAGLMLSYGVRKAFPEPMTT